MSAPPATTGYRTVTAEKRPLRTLAFDRLPATVRRTLARSLAENAAPRPLLSEVRGVRPPSAGRWARLFGVAAAAEVVAWIVGFGDRTDDPALSPLSLAILHGVAIAIAVFALSYSARLKKRHLGVPYPPGKHLFELDLVEVFGTNVRVTPLDTLRHIEARPGEKSPQVVLVFTDGHEEVFADQPDAEGQVRAARAAIEAARTMVFPQDLAHLEKVDPFLELRIGADWHVAEIDGAAASAGGTALSATSSPTGLLSRIATLLGRTPVRNIALSAVGMGLLAGTGTFFLGRSHLGDLDDTRFRDAMQKDPEARTSALEAYVARGGRHLKECEDELFELRSEDRTALQKFVQQGGPRAEMAEERLFLLEAKIGDAESLGGHVKEGDRFAERADEALFQMAKTRGTSVAMQVYLERGKRHVAEVESTLLPEALFAEARRTGSAAPLVAFAARYPESPHVKEARATVHKMYTDVLDAFVAESQPPPSARAFLQALFASIEERNDPSLPVRITTADMTPLVAADRDGIALHGDDYEACAPSMDFIGSRIERELGAWLSHAFPQWALRPYNAALEEDPKLPLLELTLTPMVDGALVSQREHVHFTSVKLKIELRWTIPGRPERVVWRATTPGLQSFDFQVKASSIGSSRSDRNDFASQVYGRMLNDMVLVFRSQLDRAL